MVREWPLGEGARRGRVDNGAVALVIGAAVCARVLGHNLSKKRLLLLNELAGSACHPMLS